MCAHGATQNVLFPYRFINTHSALGTVTVHFRLMFYGPIIFLLKFTYVALVHPNRCLVFHMNCVKKV